MKKFLFFFSFSFLFLLSNSYAGGGVTHMFIAKESIKLLPEAELRNLLLDNLDAYLTGAYYPDSGYIKGNHYGENSHWDPFIYTFANYLNEKYSDPIHQNPRLVAFLFGCAVHRVSDEVIHFNFYQVSKDQDFKGNLWKAHQYGDIGIDFILNVEKKSELGVPKNWWVPLRDLSDVYQRMGLNVPLKEMIWGNLVISSVSHEEPLISPLAYPYLKCRMPWTANHYYTWPESGIHANEEKVAQYQINLWDHVKHKINFPLPIQKINTHLHPSSIILEIAAETVAEKTVSINHEVDAEGNLNIHGVTITNSFKFQNMIHGLINKLKS